MGDWLEGKGWTKIYEYSSNTSPGKAFYLVQVLQESRGLGIHIRCHWLHLPLFLMKFFKHNLNSRITKTGKKTSKEDLQLHRTDLLWMSLKSYSLHLYRVCISLTCVFLLLRLRQYYHDQQHSTVQTT